MCARGGLAEMQLATARTADGTSAARLDGDVAVLLPYADLAALLSSGGDWRGHAAAVEGEGIAREQLEFAPVVPRPEKIFCVGLNYRAHAEEAKLELSKYPVLFAKYWRSLIGPHDDLL